MYYVLDPYTQVLSRWAFASSALAACAMIICARRKCMLCLGICCAWHDVFGWLLRLA